MEQRVHKQIRAIRNYAKSRNLDMEMAAIEWCACGLAARWAEYN
ncbi:hypothetical protein [Hahella sp. CCB-MM4]|nr:hypothetical protein [Hahella sp. CCB-MM4]